MSTIKKSFKFVILISSLMFSLTLFAEEKVGDPGYSEALTQTEKQQFEEIIKKFSDAKNQAIMEAAFWTLGHCADQNQIDAIKETVDLLEACVRTKHPVYLSKLGGHKRFKERLTELTQNEDVIVRGFGAIVLGVVGDKSYTNSVAKLLEEKSNQPTDILDGFLSNYDRSRAAIALGLLGAKEHEKDLVSLLKSPDELDRVGAALGLGYMRARRYAKDVAFLLKDWNEDIQGAAITSLAEMDAKDYAKDIAKLLDDDTVMEVSETACYALVKLRATEHIKDIAKLLQEEFRKGGAAKALAIMDAKQYTKDIADLLNDQSSFVQCDALVALGVLNAKEHIEAVSKHLEKDDEFVRKHAGLALLLMDAQKYADKIIPVVDPLGMGDLEKTLDINLFDPIVAEEYTHIKARAEKAFKKMKRIN